MRVAGGDWAGGAATYWKEVVKRSRPTLWGAVWGVICGASLTGNLVLLWPRLTLLASSASEVLLSFSIASRLSPLLSHLSPDLLSLPLARPHLYLLLNLILMHIVYRSGILSRSRPPTPSTPPSSSPPPPAFPLCNTYNQQQQLAPAATNPSPCHDHADQFQAEHSHAIAHNVSNPGQPHPYPDHDPTHAPFTTLDATSPSDRHAILHRMDIVVDVAAKKEILQDTGALPEVLSQERLSTTTINDDGDHRHPQQLLGMKHIKKQQELGCLVHDEAAATAPHSKQIMQNTMVTKKKKTRDKKASIFSIEPLGKTMSHDEDQPNIAQPRPDKKMTISYTINAKATASSPSTASSCGPASFKRSASEARRPESPAAEYPANANNSINNTHGDIESKASSLILSDDHPYYDLSKEEFNETVETFISKFRKKLSMQRQESFIRLLGLVKGRQ